MLYRLARHTNRLAQLTDFYVTVLGLEILGQFQNHSGYDGVFIGKTGLNWHLEFTQTNEIVNHMFDEDDLLVFYPETQHDFNRILEQTDRLKIPKLVAKNPYWRENGLIISDPDGLGIIISGLKIKEKP